MGRADLLRIMNTPHPVPTRGVPASFEELLRRITPYETKSEETRVRLGTQNKRDAQLMDRTGVGP